MVGVIDVMGMLGLTSAADLTDATWREHVITATATLQCAYEAAGFVFVPLTVYTGSSDAK